MLACWLISALLPDQPHPWPWPMAMLASSSEQAPRAGAGAGAGAGVLREGKSVRTIHLIDILNRTGACVMTEIELFDHKSKQRNELQRNVIGPSIIPSSLRQLFQRSIWQSFLFVNVLIQLGVFLLLLQSQLSLVSHREVWLLVHLYTDSAYPLLNLKVLLLPLSICTDTTLTSLQSCRIISCCNANYDWQSFSVKGSPKASPIKFGMFICPVFLSFLPSLSILFAFNFSL